MNIKSINPKKLLAIGVVSLFLMAGAWYYFAVYRQAATRTVCGSIDEQIISDAAEMITNSQHAELEDIENKFERDCAEHKESADYWYVALNRSIILSNSAEARDNLEQYKSLPKQEIRLAKHMQVRSTEDLESAVGFLEQFSEKAPDSILFISEPEGLE